MNRAYSSHSAKIILVTRLLEFGEIATNVCCWELTMVFLARLLSKQAVMFRMVLKDFKL